MRRTTAVLMDRAHVRKGRVRKCRTGLDLESWSATELPGAANSRHSTSCSRSLKIVVLANLYFRRICLRLPCEMTCTSQPQCARLSNRIKADKMDR